MNNSIIEKELNNLIKKETWSARLFMALEKKFYIIIFGGAVRDILYGKADNIRDIDVVLYPRYSSDNARQDDLVEKIIDINCVYPYYKNQFNGYKVKGKINTLDIWLLKNTWAFQQKLLSVSPQNLLKSVYLNIDAYAWDYNRKKFISQCDMIKANVIDIVLEESACEYLNLIRAVVFSQKYDMRLSDRITLKLNEMLKRWIQIESEVFAVEKKHYGHIDITEQEIRNVIERKYKDDEKYML